MPLFFPKKLGFAVATEPLLSSIAILYETGLTAKLSREQIGFAKNVLRQP